MSACVSARVSAKQGLLGARFCMFGIGGEMQLFELEWGNFRRRVAHQIQSPLSLWESDDVSDRAESQEYGQ